MAEIEDTNFRLKAELRTFFTRSQAIEDFGVRNTQLIAAQSARAKGPVAVPQLSSVAAGLIAGILIGLLTVAPQHRRIKAFADADPALKLSDIDHLSPDEIQTLIVKALSRLGDQQGASAGLEVIADEHPNERAAYSRNEVRRGIENIRRLLPSSKRWMLEALREATLVYELKRSEWLRISQLIHRVCKIVRCENLRGAAAVRDNRLTEILIDPAYAPCLTSDDEAIFVLAHELTHVAARSHKLDRFIEEVADNVRRGAHVEPTDNQKEDLACDFVGEMVLKRFIALNPTSDSATVRLSRVLGYESPGERFARAWEDFRASYNWDPGDDEHLTEHQTLRALRALDPELQWIIPMPTDETQSTQGAIGQSK